MTTLDPSTRGTDILVEFTLAYPISNYSEIWFTVRLEPPASTVPNDGDAAVLFAAKYTDVPSAFSVAGDNVTVTVKIPAATNKTWAVSRAGYYFGAKGLRAGAYVDLGSGRLPITPDIPRAAPPTP